MQDGGEADGAGLVPPGVVRIEGGEFAWDEEAEKSTLRGVELFASPGTLTMVRWGQATGGPSWGGGGGERIVNQVP